MNPSRSNDSNPMKWYHYLAAFLGGVVLFHIIPHGLHLLHGFSGKDALGLTVSLVVGCLFLWLGKVSIRNKWSIIAVLAGIAAVVVYGSFQ